MRCGPGLEHGAVAAAAGQGTSYYTLARATVATHLQQYKYSVPADARKVQRVGTQKSRQTGREEEVGVRPEIPSAHSFGVPSFYTPYLCLYVSARPHGDRVACMAHQGIGSASTALGDPNAVLRTTRLGSILPTYVPLGCADANKRHTDAAKAGTRVYNYGLVRKYISTEKADT
ncbi:hypothetical protein MBM_03993 [Drepanopeziza brunnea f. sp. 'multigermtubi' MB_m1]|uniref:Uncharacterized protein n=1 Tax=Marssonina brunnea f. sp. multigermtubi (strain MB_m1) TaxID=1072389 RepID=K1WZ26_MARBU|nr:uncharacterized protein MBM_03993 [Drepanopeziza brunnea f. sp. 'multigermtubi' MB_m1]EKD18221.1 hypothetical protein MBM_03993 [Drepanopeziza brunnea f. sp. 'multigermtubi' MB_m1]